MASWRLRIEGEPVPLARHRTTTRGGFARSYDPKQNVLGKQEVIRAWRELRVEQFDPTRPIRLSVTFVFSRPKSHFRTGKFAGELKPSAPVYKTTKPDIDNLLKLVKDSLTGYAYRDDSQIVGVEMEKTYGPEPHTLVEAEEIV